MKHNAPEEAMPELRREGAVSQLYVGGKPFLALGGELGNSNASDLGVLARALDRCRAMHVNTVMLPVYWDLVEPEEGKFDFGLVNGALGLARERGIRLVYLWFGTWKNSMSCYAPGWVKRDPARFPRARKRSGETQEIISPESAEACAADARAFAALMRWTRAHDGGHRTVIMAQVENEVGMIPEPRDYSEASERLYRGEVPVELAARASRGELGPEVSALWAGAGGREHGTWAEVFGGTAAGEEVFAAWRFARYVDRVAAAGQAEYPLPMFANAALIRAGYRPGQYPSGGPLPHLLEVWRAGAPSLAMICPDIYFPSFAEWCGRYVRAGNPLFIPEMAASLRAPGNAVYAAARFGAIGFGPFSVENVSAERGQEISNAYAMLDGISELILDAQRRGTITGLAPQVAFDWRVGDEPQRETLAGVTFEARFDRPAPAGGEGGATTLPTLGAGRWDAPPNTPAGAAMSIQLGPEEFLIAGMGVTVTFATAGGKGKIGIERVQEGRYEGGRIWVGGRWLNGDETHQGRHVQLPEGRWTMQRVTLYRY